MHPFVVPTSHSIAGVSARWASYGFLWDCIPPIVVVEEYYTLVRIRDPFLRSRREWNPLGFLSGGRSYIISLRVTCTGPPTVERT